MGSEYSGAGPTTPGSTGICESLSDDEMEQRDDVPHIPSFHCQYPGKMVMKSENDRRASSKR